MIYSATYYLEFRNALTFTVHFYFYFFTNEGQIDCLDIEEY